MDFIGTSDPYVELSLTGEKLPSKKTTVVRNNLNPTWNEEFKLIVKEPDFQALRLVLYDWEKVYHLLKFTASLLSNSLYHEYPFL